MLQEIFTDFISTNWFCVILVFTVEKKIFSFRLIIALLRFSSCFYGIFYTVHIQTGIFGFPE